MNRSWKCKVIYLSVLSALSAMYSPLAAQTALVSGRVVLAGTRDTVGLPGVPVMLHAVGRATQGPIDSAVAGKDGAFRFRFRADTSIVYLLSAGYSGIEYFSTPVHTDPSAPDTGLILTVSDTSSTAPVGVVSRHIVIGKPRTDGTRAALEIVVLKNDGPSTRVSPDSTRPTWAAALPSRAYNGQAGQGDISSEALRFGKQRVQLFAPIAPGEKQLIYTYQLPAGPGTVRIPVPDSIGMMNVLLEEFDRTVKGGAIARGDSQTIEGRTFRQWNGPASAGSTVTIDFPGFSIRWVLPVLVATMALSLGVVAVRALGRSARRAPALAPTPILDQIARLDATYRDRQAEVPAEEWAAYQADRARLKDQLAHQLAGRTPPT